MRVHLKRQRHGFTLIELLIVLTIIAILAMIVIPRVANAGHKAKDSQLRVNLQSLRKAIAEFNNDTGYNPYDLSQITINGPANGNAQPDNGAVKGAAITGSNGAQAVDVGSIYRGPYLSKPVEDLEVSATGASAPSGMMSMAGSSDTTSTWSYDPATGDVKLAISGTTVDGVAYSAL